MGILGGSEEELAGMIASLRERAAAQPSEANARWSVRIEIQAKGDRTRELDEMHALADLIMTVNVQPHGIRIFEAAPATFQYDRVRGEFVVMLGDAPAAPGFRHALKGGATRVLLRALDMQYLFEFDGETGVAVKRNAVELDYTLRLEPPGEIRAWQDPQITINGHPHAWEDLREGVPYDILPEQILLKVRGTAPNGEVREIQATIHPGRLEADGMRPPAPENPADPAPPP